MSSYILSKIIYNLGYSSDSIELSSSKTLAAGYELGSVFNKYYDSENLLSDQEFKHDIKNFAKMLVEVEMYIGEKRNFESFYREILNNSFYQDLIKDQNIFKEIDDNDEVYIDMIEEEVEHFSIEEYSEEESTNRIDPMINRGGQERWARDNKIAATAIKKANFLCEVDHTHKTFISKRTGKNYMEAHHLIPMSKQGDFDYSLDKVANIKCICPNCHRLLHYGIETERNKLLEVLYQKSLFNLKSVNLDIKLNELKTLY